MLRLCRVTSSMSFSRDLVLNGELRERKSLWTDEAPLRELAVIKAIVCIRVIRFLLEYLN